MVRDTSIKTRGMMIPQNLDDPCVHWIPGEKDCERMRMTLVIHYHGKVTCGRSSDVE